MPAYSSHKQTKVTKWRKQKPRHVEQISVQFRIRLCWN